MDDLSEPIRDERLPVSPRHLCPYLAVRFDTETYSSISDRPNFCHKAKPIAPVSIDHQLQVCTTLEYEYCPIFTSPEPMAMLTPWVNEDVKIFSLQDIRQRVQDLLQGRTLIFAGVALVTLILVAIICRGLLAGIQWTGSTPVAQEQPTATFTETFTEEPSLTPTLTQTLSPTLTETATPDLASTQTFEAVMLQQTVDAATQIALASAPPPEQSPTTNPAAGDCDLDWENALTVEIQDPTFLPEVTDPPQYVVYGTRAFLVKWVITNTSPKCTWSSIFLMTVKNNETQLLNLMIVRRDQPLIDIEFALRDSNYQLLNRLDPGQTATVVIQIDGLEVLANQGYFERNLQLLVNGHMLPNRVLAAKVNVWAYVLRSTRTPTTAPLPTRATTSEIPTPPR
jgi:hypothetical protein